MTVSKRKSVSGKIYWNGEFRDGTLISDNGKVVFEESTKVEKNTILPLPVNAHTHIGDSFVDEEPQGDLGSIVGPGGFKERKLQETPENIISESMKRVMEYMERISSPMFIDFRESGTRGVEMLKRSVTPNVIPIILSRGNTEDEIRDVVQISDGIGLSSETDVSHSLINMASGVSKESAKIFAMHVSETRRENMEYVLSLKPDFVVHCIETSRGDLEGVADANLPVTITPRSNYFYGKRPDYSKFIDSGVDLMLGTDNAMISTPNIYTEMGFLYSVQKGVTRISPEEILKMVFYNPHKHLDKYIRKHANRFVMFPSARISDYELVTRSDLYERFMLEIT